MRYVIIAESVEQLGGAETVAINIADYIIRKSEGHIVFLYKTGNDPDNLQWSHNITDAVKDKAEFIKVNFDWSGIIENIKAGDAILVQPDWDGALMNVLSQVKKHHQCKIITFCHCDAFAPISYYEHPSHIYAEAFEKLRPDIDMAVALNPMDQYYFECIGLYSIWWRFGTRARAQSVPKGARYNRVVAVASNWDRPFKNRKDADQLLKLAKDIGYETIRYGKAADGSSKIGTYEEIYKPGTIMVMASFAEARSDQILEAAQANIPVICKADWVPDVKNLYIYKTLDDAECILRTLKGKKVKKTSSSYLEFDRHMQQLIQAIKHCHEYYSDREINLDTTCGKAYINNLLRSADMSCHNVETDYSNNIVSLKDKLASVVFDGSSPKETHQLFGREVLFSDAADLSYEYIVFADNKLLQHNLIGEKLKALGHASIITDKDNMFIAIQAKLLKDTILIRLNNESSIELGQKVLETISSNPRYKFYKRLKIE